MKALCLSLITTCLLALSCARSHNKYGTQPISPPPPPVPAPVDILVSLENSAAIAPQLDSIQTALNGLTSALAGSGRDAQLGILRSTENADGNYDSRLQGPTAVVKASDANAAAEMDANVRALRAAPQGVTPRPLEIMVQAIVDARNASFFRGVFRLYFVFTTSDEKIVTAPVFSPLSYFTGALQLAPPNPTGVLHAYALSAGCYGTADYCFPNLATLSERQSSPRVVESLVGVDFLAHMAGDLP